MKKEREELVTKIFPQLKSFCAQRGVHFSYVDLSWGITQEESCSGKTIETCLSEIDKCRPYFLCMLGERYGWSQPDASSGKRDALLEKSFENGEKKHPWLSKYRDRSVTEVEVLYASLIPLEEEGILNERAFFYFRDPLYLPPNASEEEKASLQAENKYCANKQNSLKERIKEAKFSVKENYRSPQQLGELVLEELKAAIEEDCVDFSFLEALDKERHCHDLFVKSLTKVNVRRPHFSKILSEHFASSTRKPLLLHSPPAFGKSSILSHWLNETCLQFKNEPVFFLSHFVGATRTKTPATFFLKFQTFPFFFCSK